MKNILKFFGLLMAFSLTGCSSNTPYIGDNGNWWVGESDLGVPATGETGPQGPEGPQGPVGPQGNSGDQGPQGEPGDSITVVSCEKIGSQGGVDTYQITFSDGTKTTFTVTNGKDGASISVTDVSLISSENGIDTYQITFSDGYKTTFDVKNGESSFITSIDKIGTSGLFDTYRITCSDGSYFDFVISNGATPYIGENGNWWINGVDTGVLADYSKEDNRILTNEQKICSSGLVYAPKTILGKSGYVVQGYDSSYAETIAETCDELMPEGLSEEECGEYLDAILGNADIVIPNYVGTTPVIGIDESAFSNSRIKKISLSKNTVFIGKDAFNGSDIQSIDFNGCKLDYISEGCFRDTSLSSVDLPDTVNTLYPYAFYGCEIKDIDISNVKRFYEYSLYNLTSEYVWIGKDVDYIAASAIDEALMFVEEGINESALPTAVSYYPEGLWFGGCHRSSDYIYKINEDQTITLHRYIGNCKDIVVPSSIDGHEVSSIGTGFISFEKHWDCFDFNDRESLAEMEINSIRLPNTVTTIYSSAFSSFNTMVFIPSSVEHFYLVGGVGYLEYLYFAFETAEYPPFERFEGDAPEPADMADMDKNIRYDKGIDPSRAVYSEENKTFYYIEENSASILCCFDYESTVIEIADSFMDKPIDTIRSGSFWYLDGLSTVKIGNNVSSIKKYAFSYLNLGSAFIPENVYSIGKYAFNDCCGQFFVGHDVVPDGWDSNWNDGQTSNIEFGFNVLSINIRESNGYYYFIDNDKALLVANDVKFSNMVLPKSLDGIPVTGILGGFDVDFEGRVYVPENYVSAGPNSFLSGHYGYFYFEASQLPSGFESGWCPNGYYYVNRNMPSEQFVDKDLEIGYEKSASSVSLIYYFGDDDVIYIPREIDGLPVTNIESGFITSSKGKSVYLPSSLTSISSSAFEATSSDPWFFYFESDSGTSGYHNSSSSYNYDVNFYGYDLPY